MAKPPYRAVKTMGKPICFTSVCEVTRHLYPFAWPNPPHPLRREAEGFGKWGSTSEKWKVHVPSIWLKVLLLKEATRKRFVEVSDIQIVGKIPNENPLQNHWKPGESIIKPMGFKPSQRNFTNLRRCTFPLRLSLSQFASHTWKPQWRCDPTLVTKHGCNNCPEEILSLMMSMLGSWQSGRKACDSHQIVQKYGSQKYGSTWSRAFQSLQSLIFNRWCTHCSLLNPAKDCKNDSTKEQPKRFPNSWEKLKKKQPKKNINKKQTKITRKPGRLRHLDLRICWPGPRPEHQTRPKASKRRPSRTSGFSGREKTPED